MFDVRDLNIKNEIIPLFDYTHNKYARQKLVSLFESIPNNQESLLERQRIIQGIKNNWNKIVQPSYYKIDLEEVYKFSIDIIKKRESLKISKLRRIIKVFVAQKKDKQLMTKTIQMLFTFNKIYNHYFLNIDLEEFPLNFKDRLTIVIKSFQSFSLLNNIELIINNKFRFLHMYNVLKKLIDNHTEEELKQIWDTIFLFEAYVSVSTCIIKTGFNFPTFKGGGITLRNFYHPLIQNPVKNNLEINSHVVLITGPNMAGKSTLLKSIGLCMYLSHLGFAVPAEYCKIPFFEGIFVYINSRDDIKNGYSHFMMELINLRNVLKMSGEKKILAIFDEIFIGTNVDDALELTNQTISGLAKFSDSFFFISTHLYQLNHTNNDKYNHIKYYYIDCEINNNNPIFTYIIKEGWSELRIGKILFEKEGLTKLLQ